VTQRWLATVLVLFTLAILASVPRAQTPPAGGTPPAAPAAGKAGGDLELVQKLLTLRKDYQKTLEQLNAYYTQNTDHERASWAREELIQFHRIPKQPFILALVVPPPNLNGTQNVREANDLYMRATQYKDKGWGTDYIDNQRRSELLFQEILTRYPHSTKISDVAYMLGDIYESKAYRQYAHAAEYYQRCYQWNKLTNHDARLRAARLFDRQLNNRDKAIELYKEVKEHDTDQRRVQEADKRLKELTSSK
jgi:hypothetical protein